MRKIIAIGESVLDILFGPDRQPVKAFVGGRVANAAACLGRKGLPVTMVSECCADRAGDFILDFYRDNGVVVSSLDRYTDGATAVSLLYGPDRGDIINYSAYPADRFDVVWPRIDEDDVLLFGSFYSIDPNLRPRLYEIVSYASERKAAIIYFPGCQHGIGCRITKVMPAILENFELSDIAIANRGDIAAIYPGESPDEVFTNHIEYYGTRFLYVDDDYNVTIYSRGGKTFVAAASPYGGGTLRWQARLAASLIGSLLSREITTLTLASVPESEWEEMVGSAMLYAATPDPRP